MKKVLMFFALITSMQALGDSTAVIEMKNSPSTICKDHAYPKECAKAVQTTMIAVYNITSFNYDCENSVNKPNEKMDPDLTLECRNAKNVIGFLRSLDK